MHTQNQNKPYINHIDVDKLFSDSNNALLKKLPTWIISLIKAIIHQKDLNDYLNKFDGLQGLEFLNAVIKDFNINLIIEGEENLPENGKCFFVANHPFGIIDGLIITRTVCSKYKNFKSIGNDAFMLVPNLRPHIASVNVYGKSSRDEITKLNELYNSDIPITHFPAGEVSRIYNGKISDCKWQKSFIGKAYTCKRDIVPMHFSGSNSFLFYSIYLLRRIFMIKLNIELILLPREMLKKRNKTVRVKILKPISWEQMKNANQFEMAQRIKKYVFNEGETFN